MRSKQVIAMTGRLPACLWAAVGLSLAGCHDQSQNQAHSDATTIAAPDASTAAPGGSAPLPALESAAKWGSDGKQAIDVEAQLSDNWYIVADGSGSMASSACSSGYPEGRIGDAKQALLAFERKIPASANIGLYVFDRHSNQEVVKLDRGPANRAALEQHINQMQAGGYTPLGDAINAAYNALAQKAASQGGYGSYHLVIETDGYPEGGDNPIGRMKDAVAKVIASPVILETIGFCIYDTQHPLKQPGLTLYHDARNPADLNKDLDTILAESDAYGKTDSDIKEDVR